MDKTSCVIKKIPVLLQSGKVADPGGMIAGKGNERNYLNDGNDNNWGLLFKTPFIKPKKELRFKNEVRRNCFNSPVLTTEKDIKLGLKSFELIILIGSISNNKRDHFSSSPVAQLYKVVIATSNSLSELTAIVQLFVPLVDGL